VTLPSTETPAAAALVAAAGTHLETGPSNPLQDAGRSPRPDGDASAGRSLRGSSGRTTPAEAEPVLVVIAHGNPIGQGNIRHLGAGRPAVHQNAKTLLPWRDTIRHAAIAAIGDREGFPLDGPLRVEATFTVPKPTGAPKRRRTWPSKRPDGDHLLRACLDAMTHVVFVDDARCVELACAKRYPLEGDDALTYPGVVVRVYRLGDSK
jgi:Holliday junction resolvase RusA-like endonuclease